MNAAFTRLQIAPALVLICGIAFQSARAAIYSYDISDPVNALLNVNTAISTPIDNMQMAVNYSPRAQSGFNDAADHTQFRVMKPSALRFTQSDWPNFYDWYPDGRWIFDGDDGTYVHAVKSALGLRHGSPGITTLHDELSPDELLTWKLRNDGVNKGIGRFTDRLNKGFDIRCIELGNEDPIVNNCIPDEIFML